MRTRTKLRLLAPVAVAGLFLAACGGDDDDASGDTSTTTAAASEDTTASTDDTTTEDTAADDSMAAEETIVDIAAGNPDFSTLVAAVEAAGLAETLSGDGPFTVFAPTNEAFDAALAALGVTAEELLADPALAQILTYHVVPGMIMSTDLQPEQTVATVEGSDVTITVGADGATINDANIVATDIVASNGVIHVIDAVLLPPDLAG
ncbi:MAG: fasciclin domain-containing protein [Acidimicrobiales bacterium]|nr:fasciclin domain-containing protein [Acidimicrobiales bacterium]